MGAKKPTRRTPNARGHSGKSPAVRRPLPNVARTRGLSALPPQNPLLSADSSLVPRPQNGARFLLSLPLAYLKLSRPLRENSFFRRGLDSSLLLQPGLKHEHMPQLRT